MKHLLPPAAVLGFFASLTLATVVHAQSSPQPPAEPYVVSSASGNGIIAALMSDGTLNVMTGDDFTTAVKLPRHARVQTTSGSQIAVSEIHSGARIYASRTDDGKIQILVEQPQ